MTSHLTRLGVTPVINCGPVRTFYGNTAALPEVVEAMAEAAQCHLMMDELRQAVSRRLAELTGFEAGLVTCGSAASLFLAAAACVAGNDPEKMLALPDIRGTKKLALVPAGHRFSYDHGIRLAGLDIFEADSIDDAAVRLKSGAVAMVCVLGTRGDSGPLPFGELARAGRDHGVPVVVDAASEFPVRPDPWQSRGADIVLYSGGKFMRGPQATGLLLGPRGLVEAAWRNSSPQQAAGRVMKVGKDQMLGVLVAAEQWFAQDKVRTERERCHAYLKDIAGKLEAESRLKTELLETADWPVPRLRVSWADMPDAPHSNALREALLASDPRILIDDIGMTDTSVLLDAFGLRREDCSLVAGRIAEFFKSAARVEARPDGGSEPIDLSGAWDVVIEFATEQAAHKFVIEKSGGGFRGVHSGATFDAPMEINAWPDRIHFASKTPCEGVHLYYHFTGEPAPDRMEGEVTLGAGSAANSGPVGASQFGHARWSARRVARTV